MRSPAWRQVHRWRPWVAALTGITLALTGSFVPAASSLAKANDAANRHVLLISVDGLHASDLDQWVQHNPTSTLAALVHRGTTYSKASTSEPSDSSPGLVALVTGGSPKLTGVYYDDSYTRNLFQPAAQTATSTQDCTGTPGAETFIAENVDANAPSTANGQARTSIE
jgi:hypothetical protein